jgi:hypothetical protein
VFLSVFTILFLRRSFRVFLPPIQLGVPAVIFVAVDAPDAVLDGAYALDALLDGAAVAPDALLDGAADALLDDAADTLLDGVVGELLTGPKKCSYACCNSSFRPLSCASRLLNNLGSFVPAASATAAGSSLSIRCLMKDL